MVELTKLSTICGRMLQRTGGAIGSRHQSLHRVAERHRHRHHQRRRAASARGCVGRAPHPVQRQCGFPVHRGVDPRLPAPHRKGHDAVAHFPRGGTQSQGPGIGDAHRGSGRGMGEGTPPTRGSVKRSLDKIFRRQAMSHWQFLFPRGDVAPRVHRPRVEDSRALQGNQNGKPVRDLAARNHGFTSNPAALASSRCRLSNERKRWDPASIAAATWSVSTDLLPMRSA